MYNKSAHPALKRRIKKLLEKQLQNGLNPDQASEELAEAVACYFRQEESDCCEFQQNQRARQEKWSQVKEKLFQHDFH